MPEEDLAIEDGRITAPDGTETSYWELADDTLLDRPASGAVAPKPESDYRVVGTDVARIDLPDKLSGRPRYVHDLADGRHGVRPRGAAAVAGRHADLTRHRAPRGDCPVSSLSCVTATSSA